MALVPLATMGNYLHIYDFRVLPGREQEFIELFNEFDYSEGNPMHKSSAQVKDGVLCRDTEDPSRFFLIAKHLDRKVENAVDAGETVRGSGAERCGNQPSPLDRPLGNTQDVE